MRPSATPWPSSAAWITWSYWSKVSVPAGMGSSTPIASNHAAQESHGQGLSQLVEVAEKPDQRLRGDDDGNQDDEAGDELAAQDRGQPGRGAPGSSRGRIHSDPARGGSGDMVPASFLSDARAPVSSGRSGSAFCQ